MLGVEMDPLVDAVILERADHLEAGAVPRVRETRIAMPAEVSLEDASVLRAIEDGAPRLELAHAIGRFLRVELGHAPLVQVLPATHRVGEVHLPRIAIVDVPERRRHTAFGHDRVRLPEEALAHHTDVHAGRGSFDRRAETRATGANHQNVVLMRFELGHDQTISWKSWNTPDAAHAHVEVAEADPHQAEPREHH